MLTPPLCVNMTGTYASQRRQTISEPPSPKQKQNYFFLKCKFSMKNKKHGDIKV